jgi:hypothetical protein
MTTEAYQPVPVSAAERVATEFDKDVCVIVCYDRRYQKTHPTCFGKTPNDKVAGAALGKILSAAAGANVDRTSMGRHFEDGDKWEYALWVQYLQSATIPVPLLFPEAATPVPRGVIECSVDC